MKNNNQLNKGVSAARFAEEIQRLRKDTDKRAVYKKIVAASKAVLRDDRRQNENLES